MSERKIISRTREPITANRIYEDLRKLGISSGDVLLVHSSLSSLGWVCGGAQAVVMALMNAVGKEGTIVMPSQNGDWSDPAEWQSPPVPKEWVETIYDNMPAYDPDTTPTRGMGRIAELFRTVPNTKRSNHPQASFCANGNYAEDIIKDHSLTPQFGMESPLGKLYNLNAKVLLLGVGYDSCTSFHLGEALNDKMPKKKRGAAIMENGKRVWTWFEDYDYDIDDFEVIGREYEDNYIVRKCKVGNAECILFDIREGVNFAKTWLEKNRFYR